MDSIGPGNGYDFLYLLKLSNKRWGSKIHDVATLKDIGVKVMFKQPEHWPYFRTVQVYEQDVYYFVQLPRHRVIDEKLFPVTLARVSTNAQLRPINGYGRVLQKLIAI